MAVKNFTNPPPTHKAQTMKDIDEHMRLCAVAEAFFREHPDVMEFYRDQAIYAQHKLSATAATETATLLALK